MTRRPLGYADGLGTGIAAIGLVVIAWLASVTADLGAAYTTLNREFPFAASTKLVLSSAWRIGVPAALVAALVAAHVWRPRYALLAIGAVTLGVAAFWYWAAYEPIFRISGNIR
jgi:hypothetical protein